MEHIPTMKKEPAWLGIDSLRGQFALVRLRPIQGIVPPGQLVEIPSIPQVIFKGQRLFVKHDCASSFLIRDVFMGALITGKVNQEPIIAEPFAVDFGDLAKLEEALFDGKVVKLVVNKKGIDLLGQPWPMPTCRPGMQITVRVENIGTAPSRFLAAFYGECVQ